MGEGEKLGFRFRNLSLHYARLAPLDPKLFVTSLELQRFTRCVVSGNSAVVTKFPYIVKTFLEGTRIWACSNRWLGVIK